jgi:hypothetical protein
MTRNYLKVLSISLLMLLVYSSVSFSDSEVQSTDPTGKGVIAAQFMVNEKTPLANGMLYLYNKKNGPPSSDRYVRVPDNLTSLDKDGKFQLELPPGTYYFIARKPPEAGSLGPPSEGELIYFRMNEKGEILPFTVTAGNKTDAGIISSATPRKRNQDGHEKGVTLIEGIVTDAEGVPVQGAVILAYLTPNVQEKAISVSEKSAASGKFVLRVNDGGNYYLRIRGDYGGGAPKEGEIVNLSDPKDQIAVTVKKGENLTGLRIQVKRQHRGPLYKDPEPTK